MKYVLSPSSLGRALSCPASAVQEADRPQTTNKAAERGTRLHKILLQALAERDEALLTIDQTLSNSDHKHLSSAFDACIEAMAGSLTVSHEFQCELEKYGFVKTGREGEHQADLVWIDAQGRLNVLDYKSGREQVPDAGVNSQLKAYALSARDLLGVDPSKDVVLWICQPQGKSSKAVLHPRDIQSFELEVKRLVDSIKSGEPPFNPSADACKWCKAAGDCPQAFKGAAPAKAKTSEQYEAARSKIKAESEEKEVEALSVAVNIKGPVVVLSGEAISKARKLEKMALSIPFLATQDQAEAVSALLKEITTFEAEVEKHRKAIKKPVLDLGKEIDKAAEQALGPLSDAKVVAKDALDDYVKRAQEQAKLEAEAQPAAEAPPPAPVKIAGLKLKEVKLFEILNESAVPREYLTPNIEKIREDLDAGKLSQSEWLKVWTETRSQAR